MDRLRIPPQAKRLTVDDFVEACRQEVWVPLSEEKLRSVATTVKDVTFRRYRVDSMALVRSRLFAASDTDHARRRWYASHDDVPMAARRMITYRELLRCPELLRSYLEMLADGRDGRPVRTEPRILTLHCSSCDARWMLDGNHGFARLCAANDHCVVTVTEMTSPELGMRGCRCSGSLDAAVESR